MPFTFGVCAFFFYRLNILDIGVFFHCKSFNCKRAKSSVCTGYSQNTEIILWSTQGARVNTNLSNLPKKFSSYYRIAPLCGTDIYWLGTIFYSYIAILLLWIVVNFLLVMILLQTVFLLQVAMNFVPVIIICLFNIFRSW